MRKFLVIVLLTACGAEEQMAPAPPTMWDSAQTFCEAACGRLTECNPHWDERACVMSCVGDICYHTGACDSPPADDVRLDACLTAVATMQCGALLYPEACGNIFP